MGAKTIQGALGRIFGPFFLFVFILVAFNYLGIESQTQDAQIINLAGRQRMLVQQMVTLALQLSQDSKHPEVSARLDLARDDFQQTLQALKNGGEARYNGEPISLPPAPTDSIHANLEQIEASWGKFDPLLKNLQSSDSANPAWVASLSQLESASPDLVRQVDQVVRLYQAESERKMLLLRWLQLACLLASGVLLVAGWAFTRRAILTPLTRLTGAASRIGAGDIITPVSVPGPLEINDLSRALESMRSQLYQSQQELQTWAESLEQRIAQRTLEIETLSHIGREITSHLEINQLQDLIISKTHRLLDCDIASLCLLDEAGQNLSLAATSGSEQALLTAVAALPAPASESCLNTEAVIHCDACQQADFCPIISPEYRASHLAAPLKSGGQVLGALCVGSRSRQAFCAQNSQTLAQLADIASIAIQNSRLYEQTEYHASFNERQRLAAEVHDGLVQTINFTRLISQFALDQLDAGDIQAAAMHLRRIAEAQGQAEGELRNTIADLQQPLPAQHTLQDQIAATIAAIQANAIDSPTSMELFALEWTNHVILPVHLPRSESEQVLRVLGEALANALRHGHARRVCVSLEYAENGLALSVQDDGRGFDIDCPAADERPHFGMKIMQARATQLGGKLQVQSRAGQGTRLTLWWPAPTVSHPLAEREKEDHLA